MASNGALAGIAHIIERAVFPCLLLSHPVSLLPNPSTRICGGGIQNIRPPTRQPLRIVRDISLVKAVLATPV
jgi:hypothetical protein